MQACLMASGLKPAALPSTSSPTISVLSTVDAQSYDIAHVAQSMRESMRESSCDG